MREREHLDSNSIENTLIIGDNFDALRNLQITSSESIDVIYIDPPYNNGGSDLGYKDKFGKDAWLTLLYERLEYAHNLLKDDGVIFISIDDNMQAYLKVIMDEIFGEDNFVCNFNWITKAGGGNDTKDIRQVSEYITCYKKSEDTKFARLFVNNWEKYTNEDEFIKTRGKYQLRALWDSGLSYSENLDYPYQYNEKTYYAGGSKENWQKRISGDHRKKDICWRWKKEKIDWGIKNGFIVFKNDKIYYKQYQFCDNDCNIIERQNIFTNLIDSIKGGEGTVEAKELDIKFSHPKPTNLIKFLINLHPNKNAIILDFFAGSGTTAEAVLELNREDKGNRKYIVCTKEKDQELEVADICYDRIYKVNYGHDQNNIKLKEWLENHQAYKTNLNVYRIIKIDINLDQDNNSLKNHNFNCYKELNPNLNINSNNFLDELYGLSVRNWWLR